MPLMLVEVSGWSNSVTRLVVILLFYASTSVHAIEFGWSASAVTFACISIIFVAVMDPVSIGQSSALLRIVIVVGMHDVRIDIGAFVRSVLSGSNASVSSGQRWSRCPPIRHPRSEAGGLFVRWTRHEASGGQRQVRGGSGT